MSFTVSASNHLLSRTGVNQRWLLWIEVKEPDPSALYPVRPPVGLWSGEDDLTFMINGESRVYNGALSTFDVGQIGYAAGAAIRSVSVSIAANSPEIQDLLRGTFIRLVKAELHLALFDPYTEQLIPDPICMWRGFVNRAPVVTGAVGSSEIVTIEIASRNRIMAMPGPQLRKNDRAMRLRNAADGFLRYGAIAGNVITDWVLKK